MNAATAEASVTELYPSVNTDPVPTSLTSRRIQPLRALRAMRRLIADKDDTEQVFEIMNALSGNSIRRGYTKLLDHPIGGLEAYQRTELADILQDRAALAKLPEGSVGRAYLAFIEEQDFSAYGLADESKKVKDTLIEAAHPYAWYGRRLRDVHDLWHVITGYEADALGEACLVGFSYSQTRSLGFAVIAWGVAIQFARARTGYPAARSIIRAFRDGRKAEWLPGLNYRKLLAMPLDEARQMLNIPDPVLYRTVPKAVRNQYAGSKDALAA